MIVRICLKIFTDGYILYVLVQNMKKETEVEFSLLRPFVNYYLHSRYISLEQ